MGVVAVRVAWLLRRHWRTTVGFALAAGLIGGLSMAAWAAAHRTERVFDEFLAVTDGPELTVSFCPPDQTDRDVADIDRCFRYDPIDELEVLRRLPEVAGADRAAVRTGLVRAAGTAVPGDPVFLSAMLDPGMVTPVGHPTVVAGRLAATDADDEVMVNEAFVRTYGIGFGDGLRLRAFAAGEDDRTPAGELRSPELDVRVVGVVRTFDDLSAVNRGGEAGVAATVFTRPGVDERMTDAGTFFAAILVQARDGDAIRARAAITDAFPGRLFLNQYEVSADDIVPLQDAYAYEADAALAVAALVSISALVFVGQALARQTRREWADMAALRALGLSPRQAAMAAAVRGAVIGIGAAAVALPSSVGLSAFTPVGSARQAELDPGVQVDPLVVVAGAAAVVLLVTVMATAPVWRTARSAHTGPTRPVRALPVAAPSPPLAAGLDMALNGGRSGAGLPVGTAMAGVALAAAVLVVSAGLVASLAELVDAPARYGAPWDLSVSGLQPGEPEGVREELRSLAGVERAAALYGSELVVGTESLWTTAFEPVDGATPAVGPTIVEGREPIRADEIALGELARARLGVRVGDRVPVAVVGVAVVNSTDEGSPGLGAVIAPEAFQGLLPTVPPTIFVVDVIDDAVGEAARTELEASFGERVSDPVRQPAVRNLERLRRVPWVLAGIVAVLAAGSLAHALVLLVRRQRRQLAVLKTLGFTRRQVSSAVAWQTTTFAAVAAATGVVIGALAARIGWRAVSDRLGVVSPAVVPVPALVIVGLASVAFANLVALVPGRRAATIRPADALRSE